MERQSFFIVMKAVAADKSLSATAKLLLALLEDHRNKRTGQCNPTREVLARELGRSESTIKRALEDLRKAGLLTSQKGQRGNSYLIHSCRVTVDPAAENPAGSESPGAPGQNRPAAPPYPYMNLTKEPYGRGESARKTTGIVVPLEKGALFPLFFQCFVNAGVALNGKDEAAARRVFERYPTEEQDRIGKWVIDQLHTIWRSPEFTPTPLSALRGEGWKRQAAPRIVPKPPTKEDEYIRLLRESRARRNYGA